MTLIASILETVILQIKNQQASNPRISGLKQSAMLESSYADD